MNIESLSAERRPVEGLSPRRGLLVFLAMLVLLLPGIGSRDLWNPDEPRYAEVAREMRLDHQWFLPHLNGEVYTQKPPLLFWAINAASALTGGVDEVSTRLPSALAAAGTTLLVLALGYRLLGSAAGWLSMLVYASMAKVLWQGRVGQIDMVLGFFVALAMYCWVRGWQEDSAKWRLLFFVAAGFGTLAKGPVALLPALLAITTFLLWRRDRAELRRIPWGRGLLVWVGTVLLWLGPAAALGGFSYLEQIVFRQNVTRFADPWHHIQPWHYYLSTALPADSLPWILLLPAAVLAHRSLRARATSEGLRFALCWIVLTLAFFSLSAGKRTVYIFQMFPGFALLIGGGLAIMALEPKRYRQWLTWPIGALSMLFLAAPAALPSQLKRPEFSEFSRLALPLTALLVALGIALATAALLFWRERIHAGIVAVAAGFALAATIGFAMVAPSLNGVKSARGLARAFVETAPPEATWAIWPRLDAGLLFYSRRYSVGVDSPQEMSTFLSEPARTGKANFLAIRRDTVDDLPELTGRTPLASDEDARSGWVLYRIDPPKIDEPSLSRSSRSE